MKEAPAWEVVPHWTSSSWEAHVQNRASWPLYSCPPSCGVTKAKFMPGGPRGCWEEMYILRPWLQEQLSRPCLSHLHKDSLIRDR